MTLDFYRDVFGPQFKPTAMHSVDELIAHQKADEGANQALRSFFGGSFNPLRPLRPSTTWLAASKNAQASAERLQSARKTMSAGRANYATNWQRYDEADTRLIESHQARALLGADFQLAAYSFSVPMTSTRAARQAGSDAQSQMRQIGTKLEPFERAAAQRLVSALELLFHRQVIEKLPDVESRKKECARLLSAVGAVNTQIDRLFSLHQASAELGAMIGQFEGNRENEKLISPIFASMKQNHDYLSEICGGLSAMNYPLDHAQGDISIGAYLLEKRPDSDDLGGVVEVTETLSERFLALYSRIIGRLAQAAEDVEAAIGLEPLDITLEDDGAALLRLRTADRPRMAD